MEATITKKFSLEAPIEQVWKSLSNPKEISGCVPGATITDQIDDKNYKGEVTLKFGPIKTKYDGEITIAEMDNDAHKMLLEVKDWIPKEKETLK